MSATDANPTREVGEEQENNQGVDFGSSHVADKKELDFKSADIEKREGKDYFVNIDQKEVHRIEQRKAHKEAVRARKKFLRDNNGKIKVYSLVYIILVVVALVGVLVAAIIIKNQEGKYEYDPEDAKLVEEQDITESAAASISEIKEAYNYDKLYETDEDAAYRTAKKSAEKYIDTLDDQKKIYAVLEFASFATNETGKPERAIAFLQENEKYAINDEQLLMLYGAYSTNYIKLGNFEKYEEYKKKSEEIAPVEEATVEEVF